MRRLTSYLAEYEESHRNPTNIKIHNWCVPLIMWSLFLFFAGVPAVANLSVSALLLVALFAFYIMTSTVFMAGFMLIVSLAMMATYYVLPQPQSVAVVVFVGAWVGQFYGHKIEGKKPSFF